MLNEKEKKLIKFLVEKELKKFEEKQKIPIEEIDPGFLAEEEKYDNFLKQLLKKL